MDIYENTDTEIKIYRYIHFSIDTDLVFFFSFKTSTDNVLHVWKEGL